MNACADTDRLCTARLDRLIVSSLCPPGGRLPTISGFRVRNDFRVRPQSSVQTYARVRTLKSNASGAQIFWQYQRRKGWLKPWRITIVGDDHEGITPEELRKVLGYCPHVQFLLVELALDFDPVTEVNRSFVRRHGVFGKSHRVMSRGGPEQL